ncbi:MAG: Flp pilus assembly protein CpaB [Kiloniellales bacterium]|nr:Flp pilus assembly protein CpaB [Kiloniellales bacterium]
MSMRVIVLVGVAVLLAGGSMLMMKNMMNRPDPQIAVPAPKPTHETFVLVAARNLPTGTLVNERDLRWQAWPDESLANSYLVKGEFDSAELHGGVVRDGILEGQPIAQARVIKSGERGFLAAVLQPGFRAKSIKIGAATGVAGFIHPGDRVDIILSHTIRTQDNKRRRASETILENVRILAIDQRTDDQDGQPKIGKTITLELTAKQVEVTTVAQSLGSLSLSLRSLAEDQEQLRQMAAGELDPDELQEGPARPARTYTWENEVSLLVPWANSEGLTVARGSEVMRISSNGKQEMLSTGGSSSDSDGEGAPGETQSAEAPE